MSALAPELTPSPTTRGRRRVSHENLVLAVILTSQLMVVLDATIVNVALPKMKDALGFTPAGLS